MKRLIRATFHSNLLIPRKVVDEAKEIKDEKDRIEKILLWIDTYQSNHFMRSGDEVYHVDNPDQVLYVDRIVRKTYGGDGDKRQKIVGVECHFWEPVPNDYL